VTPHQLELLVHPASLYVGIRSTRQYVRAGEPLDIDAIVTDIDGHAVPGRKFTITASRVESRFENGTFVPHGSGEAVPLGTSREWSGVAKISNRAIGNTELTYQAIFNVIDGQKQDWKFRLLPDGRCPRCQTSVPGVWNARFEGQRTAFPFLPHDRTRLSVR